MFDIGFLELVLVAAVALVVIGPERLPGAVRTATLYLRRIKRSFNELRQEVERELHNDAVMQDLKKARDEVSEQAEQWRSEVTGAQAQLKDELRPGEGDDPAGRPEPPEKPRE